jgi:hypothetical protein
MLPIILDDCYHVCAASTQPRILTIAAGLHTPNQNPTVPPRAEFSPCYCWSRWHFSLVPAYPFHFLAHEGENLRLTKPGGEVFPRQALTASYIDRLCPCSQLQRKQAISASDADMPLQVSLRLADCPW